MSKPQLLKYLQTEFLRLTQHPSFEEVLNIHLYRQGDEGRIELINAKIKHIIETHV